MDSCLNDETTDTKDTERIQTYISFTRNVNSETKKRKMKN